MNSSIKCSCFIYYLFLFLAFLMVNFTILAYSPGCKFYNASIDDFDTQGCRVGRCSSPLATQCICSHLTSFSNTYRVPKMRFDAGAFSLKKLNQNPVAFAFCIACICIYIVLIIYCRRKDLDDLKMVYYCAFLIELPQRISV